MSDPQANTPCECNWAERAVASDRFPVSYDAKMGEYQIDLVPNGSAIMHYCPWCGGAFPESKRGTFFTDPTPDDIADLESVTALVTTVDDMLQHLGEPDETRPAHPDNPNWVNQFSYTARWASLDLCVQEKRDGSLSIMFGGKWIGDGM